MAWSAVRAGAIPRARRIAPPPAVRPRPTRQPQRRGRFIRHVGVSANVQAALARRPKRPPPRNRKDRRMYFIDVEVRGAYRVLTTPEYRFYRAKDRLPDASLDAPFATSATLDHTPTETFEDGTWWVSVSYFNGLYESGFLDIGDNGETAIRLDVVGGSLGAPPTHGPARWGLAVPHPDEVRVNAFTFRSGDRRATEWAIWYTTDGSAPGQPPAAPDVVVPIVGTRMAWLSHAITGIAEGTVVTVRLMTRRPDGSGGYVYSEAGDIQQVISTTGGEEVVAPAEDAGVWPGRLTAD